MRRTQSHICDSGACPFAEIDAYFRIHFLCVKHIARMRKLLTDDSEFLGAAVGIAVAKAHWSLDRRRSPLVVGKGVVAACRLADNGVAGSVRMTNGAFVGLSELPSAKIAAQLVKFESKEHPKEHGLLAWILDANALSDAKDAVHRICDEVYANT